MSDPKRGLMFILLGCATLLPGAVVADHAPDRPAFEELVLKVEVTRRDGSREIGSAVPLAGENLITNCHAVRDARAIRVFDGRNSWSARVRRGDSYRDLCFLYVPGYLGPVIRVIQEDQVRVGTPVYAVGYSGGDFAVHAGTVKGLHLCPCDGGRVIQTSAHFDRGASGGGLFDRNGRLVGILSFKAGAGGNFHFALPVGWLQNLAKQGDNLDRSGRTFWEEAKSGNVYFLAACSLGAKEDWGPLAGLATEWTGKEPDNPEAWMALGRARVGLGRPQEAADAFRRALLLDSTHGEAIWELQKLELDLGSSLPPTGGAS